MAEEYEVIPDPEFIDDVGEELDILPLPLAIERLAPGCNWYIRGDSIDGFVWEDDPNKRPQDEDIVSLAREIKAERPMKRLRKERDWRLNEVNWVILRSVRTGEPIPDEWKEYMQTLADLPENCTPRLSNGQLMGVTWPERPDGEPAGVGPGERYK